MRLSDILKKKLDETGENKDAPKKEAKVSLLKPFLKKEVVEKLKQQNLLISVENDKNPEINSTNSLNISLEQTYGLSIKNIKEVFTDLILEKSNISIEKIQDSIRSIINCTYQDKDTILLYCNYSTPDNYIFSHSVNVSIFCAVLGIEKNFSAEELFNLVLAGMLHDLGMVSVIKIVNQNKKLSVEEYEEVKKHSYNINTELLKLNIDIKLKERLGSIIKNVHERFDGSGYPAKLKGKEIDLYSRIISIADVYEAMTHTRPYRGRMLPHNVLVELIRSAQEQFDSNLIKVFIDRISLFPIGSYVKLNTEEIGIVCGTNKGFPIRPKVKIILNSDMSESDQQILDLSKESKIFIVEPVDDTKLNIPDKKLMLRLKSQYWWVKNIF